MTRVWSFESKDGSSCINRQLTWHTALKCFGKKHSILSLERRHTSLRWGLVPACMHLRLFGPYKSQVKTDGETNYHETARKIIIRKI